MSENTTPENTPDGGLSSTDLLAFADFLTRAEKAWDGFIKPGLGNIHEADHYRVLRDSTREIREEFTRRFPQANASSLLHGGAGVSEERTNGKGAIL